MVGYTTCRGWVRTFSKGVTQTIPTIYCGWRYCGYFYTINMDIGLRFLVCSGRWRSSRMLLTNQRPGRRLLPDRFTIYVL